MIQELRARGITDEIVLRAMYQVPRHLFMDPEYIENSYIDKAFPIGQGQTISQPYTVAYQSQLLQIRPGHRVLEIGTGSGYQACVLAAAGARVYSIERQRALYEHNMHFEYLKNFKQLYLFYGDGYEGLSTYAPFDRILITAAAPQVPAALINQLTISGVLVLPLGEAPLQQMVRVEKREDGSIFTKTFDSFSFVPMLRGKE